MHLCLWNKFLVASIIVIKITLSTGILNLRISCWSKIGNSIKSRLLISELHSLSMMERSLMRSSELLITLPQKSLQRIMVKSATFGLAELLLISCYLEFHHLTAQLTKKLWRKLRSESFPSRIQSGIISPIKPKTSLTNFWQKIKIRDHQLRQL